VNIWLYKTPTSLSTPLQSSGTWSCRSLIAKSRYKHREVDTILIETYCSNIWLEGVIRAGVVELLLDHG